AVAVIGAILIASTSSVWDGVKAVPLEEAVGPLAQVCTDKSTPACAAVRGDRSEGWLPQTRSEVMARNGIVTTVQPLAAQAGLRNLQESGNAPDGGGAAAGRVNGGCPAHNGIGRGLSSAAHP